MDTKPDAVTRVTFIPSLATFEEELAQKFSHLMLPKPPDPNPSEGGGDISTHSSPNTTTPTSSS